MKRHPKGWRGQEGGRGACQCVCGGVGGCGCGDLCCPCKAAVYFCNPPHRTASGDIHTVPPLRKQDVSGNDPFCAEWVKCKIAAHVTIPVTFLQTSRHIEHH